VRDYSGRVAYLKEAQVGRKRAGEEQVHPGPHAYDGSYSELRLTWQGLDLTVQSATDGDDLVLLATPRAANPYRAPLLVVEGGILWNRPGCVTLAGEAPNAWLEAHLPGQLVTAYGTRANLPDPHIAAQGPYLSMPLDGPVGIATGRPHTLAEIQVLVERRRAEQATRTAPFGALGEVYAAIQTCLAWDTIYEPEGQRVLTPVSRIWNVDWGGFVLFEWDNYFAAYLAGVEQRDLAYANAIEMTRAITESGFIPNFATVQGVLSRDRSEPPVGALVVRELYRKYGDRWFLEEVYPNLLRWNRWWQARRDYDGLLCWGSDPYEPVLGSRFELEQINARQGAAWESGLDNLPVYDDVPFDTQTHLLQLWDAGLNGLYVADCEALAEVAEALGRADEALELRARGARYSQAMQERLWDEERGIFLNRRCDTGAFSYRIAPTSFYPLLGGTATPEQAQRMVAEHFYNPTEFWGAWILPAIARNDPAYAEQDYWRGRIWGPLNFLVYLGLRRYGLRQACHDLAAKSQALLLREWRAQGHVHENYNAETGEGCDRLNSDAFYHWGGLLGAMALLEAGLL